MWEVVEVDALDIIPLRVAVLREGTASDDPHFDGDDDPDTFHLAVIDGGRIVGCSTWLRRPWADQPTTPAVQLRGMATDPAVRGEGIGALLIERGVARAADAGAELVWANARDSALGFYERNGFTVVGHGWISADTQLPHHHIVRRTSASSGDLPQ